MKLRIGIVLPYNITKGGGVAEHVSHTAAELRKRGHTVKVITPTPKEANGDTYDDVIFVGRAIDYKGPTHTTPTYSVTSDIEKIDQTLADEKFDILHFHEPWVPVLSRQILQRSNTVNIATFHAKVPETYMSRTVTKVFNPYMKAVLTYLHELTAVSESAAEYASGMTDQPITIIPNGIDLERYKPAPKQPNQLQTILYIGRLERRKGVKYLLQAYNLLIQTVPDVALVIAGDGPEREMLELLADDLKLPNVSFLGYVSDDLKLELLHQADLFCSPAVYGESFGIVLLEAMASGLVSVAGNNSGYTDVLQDLGAVSLVNPHDAPEFARRLELMLTQTDLRELWLKWAKDYVKQFNYPKIVDQYEELYQEALKQHENRSGN